MTQTCLFPFVQLTGLGTNIRDINDKKGKEQNPEYYRQSLRIILMNKLEHVKNSGNL